MERRRRLMAQPFCGSRARIFRRRRSRVPWTRSLGLLISVSEGNIRQLLSVSKGKVLPGLVTTWMGIMRSAAATGRVLDGVANQIRKPEYDVSKECHSTEVRR